MPYFQRKPTGGLIDIARSRGQIPGLPSRGPAPDARLAALTRPISVPETITGVERSASALTSEPLRRTGKSSAASARATQIRQLQERANDLIESFFAVADGQSALEADAPSTVAGQQPPSDAATLIVEPAPVLSPPEPIAPGGSAQFAITLVNDDEQSARVAFFSTALIGPEGAQVPAEGVSFRPRELTLLSGNTGDVIVQVVVPAHTRCGVYSGLIRASTLEYLHAVLMVQVEEPQISSGTA
jgi:hypothetical protein